MKNHKYLMKIAYSLKGRQDFSLYNEFRQNYNTPIGKLEQQQLDQFRLLFRFSKLNVPYYGELFKKLNLKETDFRSLEDLNKIPVLSKQDITANYDLFIPNNYKGKYVTRTTGGSTGKPLKYRMSIEDYSRGFALLYRGFTRGGYNIGDKMAIIAGGSLVKADKSLIGSIQDYCLNFKKLSSYGIAQEDLEKYYRSLLKWKPAFLRGYASSLYLFAKYVRENKLEPPQIKSIYSTAEMLTNKQRVFIEESLMAEVFNNYGLNDGGVTAFEDNSHEGFIIDTERSILQVIDNEGKNVFEKSGKIIATSLFNFSMPFIRYDTGDVGTQIRSDNEDISRHRLINLGGRVTDYIKIGGKVVGSPVLTVLMGKFDINRYQIIQTSENTIELIIERGKTYTFNDEKYIKQSFQENIGEKTNIIFNYEAEFINSENKHKFIIRKC